MQLRPFIALILLCLASFVGAQGSLFLTFPEAGPREIWIQTGLPSEVPASPVRTEQTSLEVPLGTAKPTDAVFVWDKKSGNLASKTVKDVQKAGRWELSEADFLDVAQITVRIEHDGKPVAAAVVTINDGRRSSQQLLDPSTKGEATFFAVKPGQVKVKVEYKSQGKPADPVTQILDAPIKRSVPVPTLTVALPNAAEVVQTAPEAGDKTVPAGDVTDKGEKVPRAEKASEPKEDKSNPIGLFVGYLVALGAAVAIGWFAIQYFKKNPDTVSAKLEQLGVQIPKPQDDDLTDGTPIAPMLKRPEPPQKIMLDDAAPDLLGSAAPTVPVMPAAPLITGQPRLVSASGDEMHLPEGETVVGRELGLGLSLVGETTVSRRHAQIVRSGTSVVVRDLGSTNGTFVNGSKISSDTPISPGTAVQFGEVRFRYEG